MAGEQNLPNGAKIGNVSENTDATKIAVFGDPDGNGLQLLGYIERSSLVDISEVNTTATPLSLATLNTTYADKPIGFVVDAPLLNLSYRKNATGWTSSVTVTVL
jgi:hypothetical protein